MVGKIIKTNSSIYLIVGNDEYRKDKKVDSIINSILSKENKELNLDTIDCAEVEKFDFDSKVRIVPFLAEKRVVVIKNVEKLEDTLKKRLLTYINNPSDLTCLILQSTLNITKEGFKKNAFLQSIGEKAETFEFYKLYENQLRVEIKEKFRKFNKDIAEEVIDVLIDRVNNNLRELDTEIEKIMLYAEDKKSIELEDVQYLITSLNVKDVYDLLNAIGDRDLVKSIEILSNIFYYSNYPPDKTAVYLITFLYNYFKKIWTVKFLIKEGYSEDEISNKINMRIFFLRRLIKQADNFSDELLKLIFSELAKSDIYIKTNKIRHLHLIIERLFYMICYPKQVLS
jgi:DNA polymerase-3 subunit delta